MTDSDEAAMRTAIEAAWAARRSVSPRPWVGAVIEPGTFVGCTQGTDGPHAEVVALQAAGDRARGATLYVTLEPCSHHGATPPCTEAIIDAGVTRVVAAIEDPDPNVAGRGFARLRAAGISVDVGAGAGAVREQLTPYLTHRSTGRPHVVLKLASTLDGRTAAADGTSQWITGEDARADAHGLRADSDAILVGARTVRADDPALTVRLPDYEGRQPRRVVLGTAPADARAQPVTEMAGDPAGVLDRLGEMGVLQVLVEGGSDVAGQFHEAGLVDRYVLYVAPALMGGSDGRPLLGGSGARTIEDVWRGEITAVRRLGDDLRIDLRGRVV